MGMNEEGNEAFEKDAVPHNGDHEPAIVEHNPANFIMSMAEHGYDQTRLILAARRVPSLLGIAKELRLEIYEHLLTTDLDCEIISRWRDDHNSNGFQATAVRKDNLVVPWVNLMLTCKAVRQEVETLITTNSTVRSWTLDLKPTKARSSLGPLVWHEISCPPKDVQSITAILKLENHGSGDPIRFWGDGGPAAITRALYQTLNHLMHCGPRMLAQRELSSPLHVKDLILRIEMPEDEQEQVPIYDDSPEHYSKRGRTFSEMARFVDMIASEGMVYGFVDRFTLQMGGKEQEIVPQERGVWTMPQEWKRYGFDWGMETYQSNEAR